MNFIASNCGLLFCIWAFIGHLYWIKSGSCINLSLVRYPSKKTFILAEFAGLPIFWITGPLTPFYRYALYRPGNAEPYVVFYDSDD